MYGAFWAILAAQVPHAESSTTALKNLLDELTHVEHVLTASTSTAARLSEEGAEALGSLTATSGLELAERPRPTPAADRALIRLVYTGAAYGLGAEHYVFELPWRVRDALEARSAKITSAEPMHGIVVQGTSIVIAADGSAKTIVEFFSSGEVRCGLPEEAWSVRTRTERMLVTIGEEWLPWSRLPAWFTDIAATTQQREYEVRRCDNGRGAEARLYTPARGFWVPPTWRLEQFEFRRGLHLELEEGGRRKSLEIVGIPANEAARRFHLLEALASRTEEDVLFVDAGSFVDGSSRLDNGALSMHRPLAFEMLARLRPAALVPGETELVQGAGQLLQEAKVAGLDYVATNWSAGDAKPDLKLPRSIVRVVSSGEEKIRVAFLGVLDPQLLTVSSKLKQDGITIDEPREAIQKEIDRLEKLPFPPDVTVVLTTANTSILQTLRQRLRGVDLIIGDVASPSGALREETIEVFPEDRRTRAPAALLPIRAIGLSDLGLVKRGGRWMLRSISLRIMRTTEHLRPDPRVREVLARSRQKIYPLLELPLLSKKPDGPLSALDDGDWQRAVCEAVRRKTGADVVLLPELPPIDRMPGAITGILIADRLAVLDHLAVDDLRGDVLDSLLSDRPGYISTVCGGSSGKILGRDIAPDRVYHVATTDRALALGLQQKLTAAHADRLFESNSAQIMEDEHGEPLSLRRAVMSALLRAAKTSTIGQAPIAPLLVDSSEQKTPAWFFTVERLSLQVERFRGSNDAAFSQVSDALVTGPSSLSIGLAGDLALAYDGRNVAGDLRVRSRYNRLSLENAAAQQLEDDLRFSSSVSLPGLEAKTGPLPWSPYIEGLFDTEFMHETDAMGHQLPRRADLSLTLGLSTKLGWLERLRVGALAQKDLSRHPERTAVFGARAETKIVAPLGHGVRFVTSGDASLYGNTSEDDPSDLRLKVYVESRLELPLARHLDIAPYARLFAFEGRVPATAHLAASYLLGLSFSVRGSFAL